VLTLLCREDAALPVIGFGAWIAAAHRRWLLGTLTAAAALAVLVVDVRWIIPAFRGQPYSHLGRYAHLGGSLTEIVTNALLHPLQTLGTLATGRRAVYLAAMLAPLAFLPLYGGWDLLGVLPALVQNLLSSDPVLYRFRAQYQSFVLPFLVLAAVGGYARLARRRPGSWPVAVLVVAMVASLTLAARTVNNLSVVRFWPAAAQRAAYPVMARVPPGAAVTAQDPYVPHLSLRPLVFVFPVGIEKADYVLINLDSYPWRNLPGVSLSRDGVNVTLAVGSAVYRYRVAAQGGPHLLLKRI
jgi:uncharacterized membrane protein